MRTLRAWALGGTIAMATAYVAIAVGCAGDIDDRTGFTEPPPPDASDAEAAAPAPGSPCGDSSGLLATAAWPLRGGCPKRASFAPGRFGPSDAVVAWTSKHGGAGSAPAVGVGTIWVGTSGGDVLALSRGGEILGSVATGGEVRSSPALAASGTTVIVGGDGALWGLALEGVASDAGAVDLDGGDLDGGDAGDAGPPPPPPLRTVFRLPGFAVGSSPVVGADGTIYVGADDALVAVAADGSGERWRVSTGDRFGSSPAIGDDGTIYVGSSAGRLYAVSPAGAVLWSFDAASEIVASPAVAPSGAIYIGSRDGVLHAVGRDGAEVWRAPTKGAITATPAVALGTVYVGSEDGALHAFTEADGKEVFVFPTQGAVGSPLVTSDGRVHVGSTDGRMYVVSPSGLLVFAVGLKSPAGAALALDETGVLFVATSAGLTAVGP